MRLKEVLNGVDYKSSFDCEADICDIAYDSRKAVAGTMFVCLPGARVDGHIFAKNAYDNGCRIFLCEKEIDIPEDAKCIFCENTRAALAVCSCNFFRHPSKEIKVIGITGTKGKTTCAHIIKSVLDNAGIDTGIIGTIGASFKDRKLPTVNTTPESYELQKLLRMMIDAGCKAAAIEVSSLGLKFHRVDGMQFEVGVFTNLYPDHIGTNEHESFEEYAYWKKQLFGMCKTAVVNIDDAFGEEIAGDCKADVITYGFSEKADYCLSDVEQVKLGNILAVKFNYNHNKTQSSKVVSLPGAVNASNALVAVITAGLFDINDEITENGLRNVFVKGRGEVVSAGGDFTVIIDYAHNGVSLKSIIDTVSGYKHNRIIALYGSVGGRTEIRRRELGLVSGELCDLTIITSDDPDFEDPESIIKDISAAVEEAGGKHVDIVDREEAIRYALSIAEPGDIIILAGKGHEEFMKINGEKLPFSERKIIENFAKS